MQKQRKRGRNQDLVWLKGQPAKQRCLEAPLSEAQPPSPSTKVTLQGGVSKQELLELPLSGINQSQPNFNFKIHLISPINRTTKN